MTFTQPILDVLNIPASATFLGSTAEQYVVSFTIAIGVAAVLFFMHGVVIAQFRRLAQRSHNDIDDFAVSILDSIKPIFYLFVALYLGLKQLSLPVLAEQILDGVFLVWVAVQVVQAFQGLIDYVIGKKAEADADPGATAAWRYLAMIGKIVLWVLAILMILGNFGVNVTSLVAGLGIAGIAVGLALQQILADLFSSFAIYFDKPFEPGDFIVVGEHMGIVEHIGIKTTRIRALQGEEIVISNQELTSARVQNFRKLGERRIQFSLGILYETPQEKVEKVNELLTRAVQDTPNTRLDRTHLKSFGDSALVFEVVYYVLSNDYNEYMDAQQKINFAIMESFTREGIAFAYPTQTLYVRKS